MKVFKFGGASVKDASAVRNMASIVDRFSEGKKLLVVVSAMGKTTNQLEQLYDEFLAAKDYKQVWQGLKDFHQAIASELFASPEADIFPLLDRLFDRLLATVEAQNAQDNYDQGYDQIVSFGEIISTHIVAHYLRSIQVNAVWLDARQYIQTDRTWREGKVDWVWTEKIVKAELRPLLDNNIIITQGFIGGTVENQTTTLGREGSDFTAAIFASCLLAESLTIWKDVPGILNADPKRLADTRLYDRLSYTDAAEMTYYGATVIHPKTIRPLANKNIPLNVRSFVEPEKPGTLISVEKPGEIEPAIIFKPNQKLVSFHTRDYAFVSEQNLMDILALMARLNIKIRLMQVSAVSVSFSLDDNPRQLEKLLAAIGDEFSVHYNEGLTLITIKNYKPETIARLTEGQEILLEQKSRHNYQVLVKSNVA